MPCPRPPDPLPPPPIWICPSCQKPMRIRAIDVVDREEQIKLACMNCGTEATESKKLSD
jgi:hypothetical protein